MKTIKVKSIKALSERRGEIEVALNGLLDAAGEEQLGAEKEAQFDNLINEDNSIKAQITRIESVNSLSRELESVREISAAAAGRPELVDVNLENKAIRGWLDSQYHATRGYVDASAKSAMASFGIDSPELTVNGFLKNASFRNDLTTGTGSNDAGNVINQRLVASLTEAFLFYGGMTQEADVLTTANGRDFVWPTFNDTSNSGSMVNEAASVGTASNPVFDKTTLGAYKGSTGVLKLTWESIRDTDVDLVPLLGRAFGERLGRLVNAQATNGVGTTAPEGITVGAAAGVTAAAVDAITFDELIDLIHSVDVAHRAGSKFMVNDATVKLLRKIVDGDGQYVWQRSVLAGQPDTLFGYPVVINSDMAAPAASAVSVIFGDLSSYKLRMVEQVRIYRLEELYRANDQDGLVAFNAFDGKLLNAGDDPVVKLTQAAA